ncbi:MAG TPA: DNA alkylation repair protein [Anaerolineae bacterium]|nr:DNA alkylation repair protein [Anaerolineae bacterium]
MSPTASLPHELATAVEHDDLAAIVAALAKRGSGALAVGADPRTAKGADIMLAARLIRSHVTGSTDLFKWVTQLLTQQDFNGHQLGLVLLSDVYDRKPKTVLQLLQPHTDNANWVVREYAGTCAGRILDGHFAEVYPVMQVWSRHKSENVRRAVVIAAMEAAKANRPKRGAKLLALLDPLMRDESRYVRVNLGPFAISLALLKNYPDLTLKWLRKHARSRNEFARWNVAMVWSAFGGRRYAEQGLELLTELATDERRFVWRAVASALTKLGKARPAVVKPVLKQWRADPARRQVAEVVSRYV